MGSAVLMKLKKSLVILRILIAVILLFSGNDYLYSYANTFEQNDSIITIEQAITIIQSSIPDELFGGHFLNEQGDIVVNVTDLDKVCVDLIQKRIGPLKIICHEVNVPLSYLEKAHEALVPYMAELGIISLDANDVTNKLDVVLEAQSREAECFIADIIDLDFVNISVMPDNYYLKFTEGDINDNSTLEGNYFSYYGNNRS